MPLRHRYINRYRNQTRRLLEAYNFTLAKFMLMLEQKRLLQNLAHELHEQNVILRHQLNNSSEEHSLE
ncbi:hypothetical protein L596_025782 [Steinernema carpocapsae]|uniref:Uncharacterized protein n=1 Tax=Steinernema carpocapsae TaxID=34508 RepID=A0A4U5M8T9_STECR|nr:hypothetical protein L596_025782 [Steinernema carpocapsae]